MQERHHFNIDDLDGYQFEELIAKIMKKKGYENIRVTSKSKDMGKDIVMDSSDGERILVECKHQKFVGRPVIQKLQGAINFEETRNPEKEVKGKVITSGGFSKEAKDYNKQIGNDITLIDGKKLKELCKKLNIFILNGKVQIIVNKSFKNFKEKEVKDSISKNYSKIYWSKVSNPLISSKLEFIPVCFLKYGVDFETYTSVGCIDKYSNSGELIIDGITGEDVDENLVEFYFKWGMDLEEIDKKYFKNKRPYEFTENDIEDYAIRSIIEENTHEVSYTGRNNVVYHKICIPKKRDIDIKKFTPTYLPFWTNKIKIIKMNYNQNFYVKGKRQHFMEDELKKCKICGWKRGDYDDLSLCPECGRIVCDSHVKIDYLDKETPICTVHAKSLKLFIQNKYFATNKNKKEYREWWTSRTFFQKLWEDKIAFWSALLLLFILIILLIS